MKAPPPAATAVVVALLASAALAMGHHAPWATALEPLELWTFDARFHVRGPTKPMSDVVLVAVDDKTLSEMPELSSRRAGFAALLDAIAAQGASVIGVDAFFAEPESPLSPALSEDVRALVDAPDFATTTAEPAQSLLRKIRDETRGDDVLEATLGRLGERVVLGLHGSGNGVPLDADTVRRARYGQLGVADDDHPIAPARTFLASLPRFNARVGAAGLVTVELDDDRVGRRVAVARRHGDAVIAPLSVHVAARALALSRARVAYLPGDAIVLGDKRVAVTSSPRGDSLVLDFRGPRGTFPTYSAVDVVKGRVPPDALANKPVLVGFTYSLHDVSPTPFDGSAPGLEVNATAVDNLIAGDALRRAPPLVDAALTLALGLIAALLYTRFGPQRASLRLAASLALVLLAAIAAYVAFINGAWLALAGPAATTLLASGAALVTAYLTEGAERRRLRKAFAHYLADEIIDELMRNPQALALGGARRDVTLLFSDIRGFTTLSEKMAPQALATFLNRYLTPMTRAVLAERGFLDKYIGDALMAVFGAPAPSTDHPDRALAAALRMHAILLELHASLDESLAIGVGINTGDVVAGNMGSEERFDYTVIGDAVNLASRLEALTKRYGVFCIVGDATRQRATSPNAPNAAYVFRELDLVRVKGRSAPVAIHELVPSTLTPPYVDLATFARALAAYRAGRFADARAAFAEWRAQNPRDPVGALYLERLAKLGDDVPAAWDGVFEHLDK